jgi:hypothetical protein
MMLDYGFLSYISFQILIWVSIRCDMDIQKLQILVEFLCVQCNCKLIVDLKGILKYWYLTHVKSYDHFQ